jgi:hypothetical protein
MVDRLLFVMDVAAIQRRTLRLLFAMQIIRGIGVAIGASVGALLAADIAGVGVSGVAQSAIVVGCPVWPSATAVLIGVLAGRLQPRTPC